MRKPESHKAKKSLGQNFLTSHLAAQTLVKSAEVSEGDSVVEVGPGKGVITKLLLSRGARVIAVEKDEELCERLKEKFADEVASSQLVLVAGDILEFDPAEYELEGGYILLGSIPYNITGVFIRTFLSITPQPRTLGLIIQKEVAERIVARDGKESLLSLSVSAFGKPEYIKTIKKDAFSPKPNVDSAVLVVKNISRDFFSSISEDAFFEMLKIGHGQRRKMVISNLAKKYDRTLLEEGFSRAGVSPSARAEEVSLEAWRNIAGYVTGNM